jgi:hypothetical protein
LGICALGGIMIAYICSILFRRLSRRNEEENEGG